MWADTNISEATTSSQQGTDLLAGLRGTAGAVGQGLTVMGVIVQQNAVATGASGTFSTAFRLGLIVATASLESDLPDVVSEPYADWMWNSQYYLADTATVAGALAPEHQLVQMRARRKVEEIGDSLWLVFQPRLGGADSVAYDAHVRVLVALP